MRSYVAPCLAIFFRNDVGTAANLRRASLGNKLKATTWSGDNTRFPPPAAYKEYNLEKRLE